MNFEIPFREALRHAHNVTECGSYEEGERFCYYAQPFCGHVWTDWEFDEVLHAACGEFELARDDKGLIVKAR